MANILRIFFFVLFPSSVGRMCIIFSLLIKLTRWKKKINWICSMAEPVHYQCAWNIEANWIIASRSNRKKFQSVRNMLNLTVLIVLYKRQPLNWKHLKRLWKDSNSNEHVQFLPLRWKRARFDSSVHHSCCNLYNIFFFSGVRECKIMRKRNIRRKYSTHRVKIEKRREKKTHTHKP